MVNLKLAKGEPSAMVVMTDEPAAENIDTIKQAAQKVVQDVNAFVSGEVDQPQPAAEPNQASQIRIKHWFQPRQKHISAIMRFLNFILIPLAAFYCLTMLLSLKISLIGRLGGINHIARAFFLSLLFFILLMPWQLIFSPVFAGAMFTSTELIAACEAEKTTLAYASMYLRFTVYWFLVLLLLLFSQIRSMRWARATLRRLEVI